MTKLPHIHLLGHPFLSPDLKCHPENGQLRTSVLFARLLSQMGFTWSYYGVGDDFPSLPLDDKGEFLSLMEPPGISSSLQWEFRGKLHRLYSQKLKKTLRQNLLRHQGEKQIIAALHGLTQIDAIPKEAELLQIPLCEPMTGYNHCFTPARVFPSLAQQNVIYATCNFCWGNQDNDRVIPHFLFPEDYPFSPENKAISPYLLYLGRNVPEKGLETTRRAAKKMGIPLKVVTQGCHGKKKLQLLTNALAVLMPTQYAEPFGYVAIESLFCGTPVIASAWGSFPEIIRSAKDGYLCQTQQDYVSAINRLLQHPLNREGIRANALRRFSATAVAPRYKNWLISLLK